MLDILGINQLAVVLGALSAGIVAVWGLMVKSKRDGRKDEREERSAADAQAYIEERKRQDQLGLGVGASDAERVRMLRDIADRGSAGNP